MAETKSDLLAKLKELHAQVDQYTTEQGNRIAEAVAAARAAQQKDDQAAAQQERDAALAEIEDIGKGLVTFSTSGN